MTVKFCQENISIAVLCLFLLAAIELTVSAMSGVPAVHTGTCIGAIAGVIIPSKE